MTDILLSNSYFLGRDRVAQKRPYFYPPLGLLYVAAYVRQMGLWHIDVFDSTFAQDESEYERVINRSRPQVVGIQALVTTRRATQNMIRIAKKSGACVIVGGPDPTVCYQHYLDWGADFVVIGEGELTTAELLLHLTKQADICLWDICGLAYRDNNGIAVTPPRELKANLDEIPRPALGMIEVARYFEVWKRRNGYTSLSLLTSRGCPFTCTWCSRAVFGQSFRQRSVYNVVDEMQLLKEQYDPDTLWIVDDTFGLNRKWLEHWCNEVVERRVGLPFRCFTRADTISPEILAQLRVAGCERMHIGVESGSQRILDAMKKRTRIEDVRRAARQIHKAGIKLNYFIMFGYPGEDFIDIQQTEQLIFETAPDSIGYSIAYPVPGTEFYDGVKDQLKPDVDDLWERTSQGLQLLFRAPYPLIYYRSLVQFIESRRRYLSSRWLSLSKFVGLAQMVTAGSVRWLVEHLFTLVRKAHRTA